MTPLLPKDAADLAEEIESLLGEDWLPDEPPVQLRPLPPKPEDEC